MASPVKLTVDGSCTKNVPPERGEVRFTIRKTGSDLDSVINEVNLTATSVREHIEPLADKSNVSCPVSNYTISSLSSYLDRSYHRRRRSSSPSRSRSREGRYTDRHEATITVTAEFTDIDIMSNFIFKVGKMPMVQLEPVSWSVTSETRRALQMAAIGDAYKNALTKAEACAAAMGKQTIVPIDVDLHGYDGGNYGGARYRIAAAAAEPAPSKPVPEDISVSTSMKVHFECS